jgi:hypothetical protein
VAGQETYYIKHFGSALECAQEADMLRILQHHTVPFVPSLEKVSVDGLSLLASPVGRAFYHWQGRGSVWKIGHYLLTTFERLHASGFCHRDVRPSNIVVQSDGLPVLIDWASAASTGTATTYVGTTHYAAQDVLTKLENLEPVAPSPEHDLESLVYSIYDLSRDATNRPTALSIQKEDFRLQTQFYAAIRTVWEEEAQQKPNLLPSLLHSARSCNYEELKLAFDSKF